MCYRRTQFIEPKHQINVLFKVKCHATLVANFLSTNLQQIDTFSLQSTGFQCKNPIYNKKRTVILQ